MILLRSSMKWAYFNSIKVRLEQVYAINTDKWIIDFNSIKVRLEHEGRRRQCCKLCYFNSIKVRLELPTEFSHIEDPEFQFHKGTIRTLETTLRISVSLISIP